jgi:hypothetical protein
VRFHHIEQIFGHAFIIQRPSEGGIGQDEGVGFGGVAVVLGQAVAVVDVGLLDAVQHHVHGGDAQHGAVEIEAVKHIPLVMGAVDRTGEDFRVMAAQVFIAGDEETGRAAGWVADDAWRPGGDHLHHQLDDVARGAELTVLPGRRQLAEHVFVEVAFGVPIFHRDAVEHVYGAGQQPGLLRWQGEAGVLHVPGEGGAFAAHHFHEGENPVDDEGVHLARFQVFETGPAVTLLVWVEDGGFDGLFEAVGFVFA